MEAEERYTRDMKETREEASRRIKELENNLTALTAKYEMLQAESKKAEEVSSARCAPKPPTSNAASTTPNPKSQCKINYSTEMCSDSEAGSHSRLIDFCITQL